ncbi:spore coat protein [Bacillus sinesaloumensis]|uniref:spore coat protein n=1 Tax=Litchfieldia sinesaloumensis TaxID=1926280 RepID=UPI0009886607|nr:spore coat protein [Bacillus sinesaloumensis]
MNDIFKKLVGMGGMTDQVIATDFLISAKAGVRNLAFAITEASTPKVRAVLREQLRHAVETHKNISDYMIEMGMYHPTDLGEQLNTDLTITKTSLELTD